MRVGAILCAGGSAFHAAASRLSSQNRADLFAVTDRACEAENRLADLRIEHSRIADHKDRQSRSAAIASAFREANVGACIVLYDRLVTSDLYDALPCVNIHPSILPLFPGMSAVKRAFDAGQTRIGVTAHLIDETVDGGPILGQRVANMPSTLAEAEHVSFKLKADISFDVLRMLLSNSTVGKPQLIERFASIAATDNISRAMPQANPSVSLHGSDR